MFVYLAGSIDAVDVEVANGWRKEAADFFLGHGIGTFNPVTAYSAPPSVASYVAAVNRSAIRESTAVLALVDQWSFGTIREIEFASMHGKPVVVYSTRDLTASYEAQDLILAGSLGYAMSRVVKAIEEGTPCTS